MCIFFHEYTHKWVLNLFIEGGRERVRDHHTYRLQRFFCPILCLRLPQCLSAYVIAYIYIYIYIYIYLLQNICLCVSRSVRSNSSWPWAHQVPLSMGFSRQEYWSGLPFPTPGDLPNPVIKPMSLESPTLAGRFFTTSTTWEAHTITGLSPDCVYRPFCHLNLILDSLGRWLFKALYDESFCKENTVFAL